VYTSKKHFAGKTLNTLPIEKKEGEKKKKSLKNFSAIYICYCSSRLQQLSKKNKKKKRKQLKHDNSRSSSSSSG
jgi:hypothetical protein